MISRRCRRKLFAFGIIILGHVLLLWFIIYSYSNSHDGTEIRGFGLANPRERWKRRGAKTSKSVSSDSTLTSTVMNQNREQKGIVTELKGAVKAMPSNAERSKLYHISLQKPAVKQAKPSQRPSIDIVNDYYPFVDFKFVFPEISPNVDRKQDIFMIVLVNSAARGDEYRKRREVIRQTWGNRSNCEQRKASEDGRLKDLKWLLVFVLGKAGPETNDDELNKAEARQHNDMLIGNITDNYINNVVKFFMAQVWASRFDIKYTMKTDDDVYVRIPRVLEYLVNAKFPKPFYGGWTYAGTLVNREIGGKWTVSWKYYGEKDWPRFNPGAFFILSSDLLTRLFNYVHLRKPFHTDDAYVGVAMRDFGVEITTINSFRISADMPQSIRTMADCYLKSLNAFGHSLDHETSKILDRRLNSLICGHVTKKC